MLMTKHAQLQAQSMALWLGQLLALPEWFPKALDVKWA
jgi:hypothetical protein